MGVRSCDDDNRIDPFPAATFLLLTRPVAAAVFFLEGFREAVFRVAAFLGAAPRLADGLLVTRPAVPPSVSAAGLSAAAFPDDPGFRTPSISPGSTAARS